MEQNLLGTDITSYVLQLPRTCNGNVLHYANSSQLRNFQESLQKASFPDLIFEHFQFLKLPYCSACYCAF